MRDVIKIKKGLTIDLKGKPEKKIVDTIHAEYYSICPEDFHGLAPKLSVKPGDKVLAGTAILYDKNHPEVKVVSPVSGEVVEVNRGEKRKILNVLIAADKQQEYLSFEKKDLKKSSPDEIKQYLAQAGLFSYIKQRPYDIIANPADSPRDIFISCIFSAPLAPDFEFITQREIEHFIAGLRVIARLTTGCVYLALSPDTQLELPDLPDNIKKVYFEGPHPTGNVGVQINHLKPVNKGEIVWTINALDVLFFGRLFARGVVDLTRLVALTGSEVKETGYFSILPGAPIKGMVENNVNENSGELRYISGHVLTGKKITAEGYLDYYANQVTVIPEGKDVHEFFGWASPGINKFSFSKTFLSTLLGLKKKEGVVLDARLKGGHRTIIMSNEYDRVFPMDILPEFLIKAIIAFDVDKMENLGIYEVAPEDFALCEFVDTSKLELQQLVRNGLQLLHKEMS